MFVTLEDFFNNYRIKNQLQPNETVLNRGLMRLKRETRELKSVIDNLTGAALPTWNNSKIYETDEYVTHNDLIYKSVVDTNFDNEPSPSDATNWELVTLSSVDAAQGTVIRYETFAATAEISNIKFL